MCPKSDRRGDGALVFGKQGTWYRATVNGNGAQDERLRFGHGGRAGACGR